MQTILNEKRSDIGSPYVYYTLEAEPSNRSATQVDIQVTIKSHLASSQSSLLSGTLEGFFEFQDNQNRSIEIKSSSESWSGTTEHISTSTFTLQASASQTSITCKFKVDRSGGSAGTLYELETDAITIPIGHEVPSDISYTMTETNPLLVSAGISNDLIVENLSIKDFAISYTLHGGATMTRVGMYNRSTPYSAPSSPFSIDLRITTFRKNADNTKIPLRAFVKDSFQTQGLSSETLYDYIAYSPVIIGTTSAKRDGQLSGKVKLSLNGTFYNGIIGNVDQSNYKPIIKYKIWESSNSEPSTWDYTISRSNISVSNTDYNVSNLDIGTTVETQPNYFNPDNIYKIKIQVKDNFTEYISNEITILKGEYLWAEYPKSGYVDFKEVREGNVKVLESGVDNGIYYEKRSDGIGICYGSVAITANQGRSAGGLSYYSGEATINLPITYLDTTQMFGYSNVAIANMNYFCQSYVVIESTSQIRVLHTNTTSQARAVHYMIIGKWK